MPDRPDLTDAALGVRAARLHFNDWAGRYSVPVIVVGETPTRYRIRVEQRTRLAGRGRYLSPGETALVPRDAVTFATEAADVPA